MQKFKRAGALAKASTAEDGSRHLLVLASGPEVDKSGERVSKAALDQLVASSKAGTIRLTPSHDVPITLGKSVDATQDGEGHVYLDFHLSAENPLAVQLHDEVQAGDWADRQVSIGGRAQKALVYDEALKKSVTELTALDVNHVALTFPDHGVYPRAALTEALVKALKAGDHEALKAAGLSEDEIEKGMVDGVWTPQTFGAAWASKKLSDELPEMLDALRWNVETILWVDDSTQKRALLAQTFAEFTAAVLGTVDEPLAKAAPILDGLTKALSDLQAAIGSIPAPPPAPAAVIETPAAPLSAPAGSEPVVVNKAMPDTTPESAASVSAPDPARQEGMQESKKAELRKAIEAESDPLRRANLAQELNAINATR